MSKNRNYRFVPLYVSLGVVLGILIGSFYANQYSQKYLSIMEGSGNKLVDLLYIIDDQYVDQVDMNNIIEKAFPQILRELDPHSVYISASDVESAMQGLNGSFSGIGVQFMLLDDTVRVVHVIPGGPAEGSGLLPGDRIISAGGKPLTGREVTNDHVMKSLKGREGSNVGLKIRRTGVAKDLDITITRGEVPLNSVTASYMLNDTTGYIAIGNFGETTYAEFLAALASLNTHDFRNLIIDLRGNLGGYMTPAIQIANEFLPKDRLIVYTEGRKSPREEYTSDGRGSYQSMPLIILVDETSASASEILAGAIQDNDRGTIVGRRTFGKGLVQVPIEFGDGSMVRLTKARYYTPSGRCLQKPYTPGMEEDYEMDLVQRMEHGEYYSRDSIRTQGNRRYHTRIGRIVYGGGGIIPDEFVPMDTTGITSYFKEAYSGGYINQFSYVFVDSHRGALSRLGTIKEVSNFLKRQNLLEAFARYAETKGLKRRNLMLAKSRNLFEQQLFQGIISDAYSTEKALEFTNTFDPTVLRALDILRRGKAFPQK